jgi:hypothetical protein
LAEAVLLDARRYQLAVVRAARGVLAAAARCGAPPSPHRARGRPEELVPTAVGR